jgi:hypothetical protein
MRNMMKLVGGIILASLVAACTPMKVRTYPEPGVNFANYHSYAWAPDDLLFTGDPRLDNNPFFLRRLQAGVEQQLSSRGFEKTGSTPDLVVHYHANVGQRLDLPERDPIDGHCNNCTARVYEEGTLMLDFVDVRTRAIVWRGWAEGALDGAIDNQSAMETRIDDAVGKILRTFPGRS